MPEGTRMIDKAIGRVDRMLSRPVAKWVPEVRQQDVMGLYRPLLYRGGGLECPCCRGRFRAFRTHKGRRNAICPKCGAKERHRQLWLWLERETDLLSAELDVLHIAPEPALARHLSRQPQLRYVSGDLMSPLAAMVLDVTDIPFPDDRFDVILCSHVLEHVQDDRRAMQELHRVLRPGGWAVLQVPIEADRARTYEDPAVVTAEERLRIFGQDDHVRIYGRDYTDRLEAAGFRVAAVGYAERLPAAERQRHALRPAEPPIYLARKPAAAVS
jgi:SAM-dependent methyltransferase